MIPKTIRIGKFSLSRTMVGLILVAVVLFAIKFFNIVGNVFTKVKTFLGFSNADEKPEQAQVVQEQIQKSLEKNAGVRSQNTPANKRKAQQIHDAISGWGVDMTTLREIFRSITGPNQMGAVSLNYGIRKVWVVPLWNTGDLQSNLKWRLTSSQYKEFKPHLDLLNNL